MLAIGFSRGYALATSHCIPVEFFKFRPKIQKAFAKCNAFFPEIDITRFCRHKEIAKWFTSRFGQKLGAMDLKLTEQAKAMGKQVISLESERDHFRAVSLSNPFFPYPTLTDLTEIRQCWEKGSSNELSQHLHKLVQYAVGKHDGLGVLQCLITDRNITMSDQMDKALNEKSLLPFFAVGCDHFPDHVETGDGLISLLVKKGWSCIPT